MNAEQTANALLGAASLSVLFWLVFVELHKTFTAYYRTHLFVLRDELFSVFSAEGCSYDHDAHTMLRNLLNGLIAEAELLNPIGLYIVARSLPEMPLSPFKRRLDAAIGELPSEELRAKLRKLHARVLMATMIFIAFGSPSGLLCTAFILARLAVHVGLNALLGRRGQGLREQVYAREVDPVERGAEYRGTLSVA
jgi:hypothetical protein